jgi:polysaccharide pyruvyl transferase WcaK-like protein
VAARGQASFREVPQITMRVSVHGSYFGYNFGDTLLCQLFVDWVRAAGQHEVVLPLANAKNQHLIGADLRGLGSALGSERAIFGGGGYFSESASRGRLWSLRVYSRHLLLGRLLKARRIPLAIMGVGVGPISSPQVRRSVVDLFDYAQVAVVRDEESASHLRDWGVRRDPVVASDAVLSADLDYATGNRADASAGRKRLLVHTSGNPSAAELSAIREVCAWAADRDLTIVFATDGVSRRGAIGWPSALAAEFPALEVEIDLYDGSPAHLIRRLAKTDGIVTTKLHVGIVGTKLGIPVIAAPLHSKTVRFYRQIGAADRVVELSASESAGRLRELLDSWNKGRLSPSLKQTGLPSFNYRAAVAEFLH